MSDNPSQGTIPTFSTIGRPLWGLVLFYSVTHAMMSLETGTFTNDEERFQHDVPPSTPGMCTSQLQIQHFYDSGLGSGTWKKLNYKN